MSSLFRTSRRHAGALATRRPPQIPKGSLVGFKSLSAPDLYGKHGKTTSPVVSTLRELRLSEVPATKLVLDLDLGVSQHTDTSSTHTCDTAAHGCRKFQASGMKFGYPSRFLWSMGAE